MITPPRFETCTGCSHPVHLEGHCLTRTKANRPCFCRVKHLDPYATLPTNETPRFEKVEAILGDMEVCGYESRFTLNDIRLAVAEEVERAVQSWQAAAILAAEDIAFFHFEDREFVTDGRTDLPVCVGLLVSDTFAYACADAESIRMDEAPAVLKLYRDGGWPAVVRFVGERRRADPIKPVQERLRGLDEARAEGIAQGRTDERREHICLDPKHPDCVVLLKSALAALEAHRKQEGRREMARETHTTFLQLTVHDFMKWLTVQAEEG